MPIETGSIWWIDLKGSNLPSEISKIRPCFVISKTERNKLSNFITVLPITSKTTNNPLHINLLINKTKSQIIPYLISTISKKRLHLKIHNNNEIISTQVFKSLSFLFFQS